MTVISVKCGDVITINHIFGPFIDIVHKNKLHRWIPEMKLNQKSAFYFQNFEFWKLTFFDLFWPFLTWPWGQIWKLPLPLDSTSKITYITCVARLLCSFPHDDLFVTWPWPWPVLTLSIILFWTALLLLTSVFGEFGRSTVDSPVSMGNNPKTHISDLWPDLDLTCDLFKKIF